MTAGTAWRQGGEEAGDIECATQGMRETHAQFSSLSPVYSV